MPLLGACVALHVRNGDASMDLRNAAGHNLSFAAHVKCVESMAQRAGIYDLYLATDNVTLFDIGVRQYPQYGWYHQQRPLLVFDGTNPSGTRKNAHSPQEDLADVLTDCILMSRCTSIMRSYSALSDLFLTYMCNRNAYGLCPPDRAVHGKDCQAELTTPAPVPLQEPATGIPVPQRTNTETKTKSPKRGDAKIFHVVTR